MMKIVCTQEHLAKALSILERASGRHASLPILSNILIQTENGRLKLSATNLEIGVRTYIGAKIDGEGEMTAPVKIFSSFVSNLSVGDIVEISIKDLSLSVTSGKHAMRVKGLDAKDFPIIPDRKGDFFLSIDAQSFKDAIQRVAPAASASESQPELCGINVVFSDDGIDVAATDRFRLAEEHISVKGTADYSKFLSSTPSVIFPHSALHEVIRVINPETSSISMVFEENQTFFEVDGTIILSRLVNGKFPDYKQIIPKQYSYDLVVSREELLKAVRMASIFSPQQSGEVNLIPAPNGDGIVVMSQSSEIGENSTAIAGTVTWPEDLRIAFHPRHILDAIGAFGGEMITIRANASSQPVAFFGADPSGNDDPGFTYLVMPIKK